MTKSNVTVSQTGFGMPTSGCAFVAVVRALPATGVVLASAGWKSGRVDVTPVCGYRHIADVAAVKGAFAGVPAWSPPI